MLSPYQLQENDDYSYEFVTQEGVIYTMYFLDYSGLFSDYPSIAKQVFTFNIDVIEGSPENTNYDERIGVTVLHVFKLFFENRENVVVYVCDNLDDRHLARKRKFDSWFWRYNDGSLIKEDDIAMVEGVEIYNSMIIHKMNAKLNEIIIAFKELNMRAGEK
ncbi:MAG: DUF6169 family protein [Cyclobacteriaceae bacterium]